MKYIVFAILIAAALSTPPIPTRPDGYIYKPSPNKVVRLDVYEDLLCSDCKSFEPGFKQYLNTYKVNGKAVTDFVEVSVHIFPLPYHHHAFFVSQLVPFIYDLHKNNTEVFQFIDWIFKNQNSYLSGSSTLSEPQVKSKLCNETSTALKLFTKAQCDQEFSGNAHNWNTRVSWKYGTYNGVSGTPTVFLNGVEVDAPETYNDWVKLLTPYRFF